MQKVTYSLENPNPEWKNKGEKWIAFAQSKKAWNVGEVYDVAYIPSIPIEISQGVKTHNILPTAWDLSKVPDISNFDLGGGTFRLNGKYKNPENMFVGSKKHVNLSVHNDVEAILDLLKIAEKIYDVPQNLLEKTSKKN